MGAEWVPPPLPSQAQYRRGLELSKQAAQLGATARGAGEAERAEFPELAAFASTQRAFQAKLTHFYMAAERQRTDLETLLHLHRFCKRVSPTAHLHRYLPIPWLGLWWGQGYLDTAPWPDCIDTPPIPWIPRHSPPAHLHRQHPHPLAGGTAGTGIPRHSRRLIVIHSPSLVTGKKQGKGKS